MPIAPSLMSSFALSQPLRSLAACSACCSFSNTAITFCSVVSSTSRLLLVRPLVRLFRRAAEPGAPRARRGQAPRPPRSTGRAGAPGPMAGGSRAPPADCATRPNDCCATEHAVRAPTTVRSSAAPHRRRRMGRLVEPKACLRVRRWPASPTTRAAEHAPGCADERRSPSPRLRLRQAARRRQVRCFGGHRSTSCLARTGVTVSGIDTSSRMSVMYENSWLR